MKKTILLALLVIALSLVAQSYVKAQELYFCESVTDNGQPNNAATTFTIPKGGGYFYFLVKLPYVVGCTNVDYAIYKADSYGNQKYNTTISQVDMGTDWTWFWKKVTFYEPGYYRIDVIDCASMNLVSSYVTIKMK